MGYFANGTEGDAYEESVCMKCQHYGQEDGPGCAVWMAHLIFNYSACDDADSILHMLIPRSADGISNELCKMFLEVPKDQVPK